MFIKSCFLLVFLIKYAVSERLFDSNERRESIIAAKNEPYVVKKQPNDVPLRGRQQKTGDFWETAHDRLFGEPMLINESDNTINRNLEVANQEGQLYERRRVYGQLRRGASSGSSMALMFFMLIVVVSMAVVWMEVDSGIFGDLFRVVSLDASDDEERAHGRSSSRRSSKKKSKKKRKSSKSKRSSRDDYDSDSDSDDGDLEAQRKSKKKKKHRSKKKKHQHRSSEDSF